MDFWLWFFYLLFKFYYKLLSLEHIFFKIRSDIFCSSIVWVLIFFYLILDWIKLFEDDYFWMTSVDSFFIFNCFYLGDRDLQF